MKRRFYTLDVFAPHRFAGNPLAVVIDGDGISADTMQAIAREFGLPETVFVLPPQVAAHRAAIRIFTPVVEMPFAGHPTVGTAVLLRLLESSFARADFVISEGIGPVHCSAMPLGPQRGHARFCVPLQPDQTGGPAGDDRIAAALGLSTEEIGFESYRPGRWSAGVAFDLIPVCSLAAIKRARPVAAEWRKAFPEDRAAVYLYCPETVEPRNAFHARMFAPGLGIREDPATGSAAAALAGVVARHGGLADGRHALAIEQGYELGRPSSIELDITLEDGKLQAVHIAGNAVIVSEGHIHV